MPETLMSRELIIGIGGLWKVPINELGEKYFPGSVLATGVFRRIPKYWYHFTGQRLSEGIKLALEDNNLSQKQLFKAGVLSYSSLCRYRNKPTDEISSDMSNLYHFFLSECQRDFQSYFEEAVVNQACREYEETTPPGVRKFHAAADHYALGDEQLLQEALDRAFFNLAFRKSLIEQYETDMAKIQS